MKMILDRAGLLYKILLASVLGLMVLIVFVNVVLRKFFHSGLSFTEEALRYLFIWMSYLGIVAAYKTNSHIRVTLVSEKLPVKWRAALGLMMNVIIMYALWFCANGAFAYIGINYGTYGELVKIPYYLVISSIVFACLGLAVLIF
ncbi:MAG: TRAP transporter small permease, partial [Planctomycetes bacterium]|nr:TRAP transporter small permease [Planctomycetota bacterium]